MLNTDCPTDQQAGSDLLDGLWNKIEQEALHFMHSFKHVKQIMILRSVLLRLGCYFYRGHRLDCLYELNIVIG